MMLRIHEIMSAFEAIAPLRLQESYDNSGLIVGDPQREVKKALLCLDSTEAVVDEAIAKGCDIIIAHHPIVFGGLKRFTGSNYVQRAVMKAIKHDIAIYACHTNLDNVLRGGVNERIAQQLGVKISGVLRPMESTLMKLGVYVPLSDAEALKEALFAAGAGHIGNYDECAFVIEGQGSFRPNDGANPTLGSIGERELVTEARIEVLVPIWLKGAILKAMTEAHPYEEVAHDWVVLNNVSREFGAGVIGELPVAMGAVDFLQHVKSKMGLDVVKFTKCGVEKVQRVAICGGAGSFLIGDAMLAGADAFVTSDVKYHEFFDAEEKMLLCDIGHYESEKYTIDLFSSLLSLKFPKFATIFAETITNPIDYLR
jgi:dinuclear metal center YbgI/SA1388 family protein